MNKDDIYIISKNSNWSEQGIDKVLRDKIYADSSAWKKFLELLFISLGIGFTVSGIIFFFAYNWAGLHKFAKIGMVEALIVIVACLVLFSKLNLNTKNILLTALSGLVGVMLAVFGQIYQTGANAYDFFMGWTLFITLWVVVSNYPPQWLVFLTLINTTFVLYSVQVAPHWSEQFLFCILFTINTIALLAMHTLPKIRASFKVPLWLTSIVALAAVIISTIGIIIGIFNHFDFSFSILLILTILAYTAGITYGFKTKSGFYLAIIPFSIIVVLSALLIKFTDNDVAVFFTLSLFIIASISALVIGLINIQKRWNNGK